MENQENEKPLQRPVPGKKKAAAGLFVNVIFPGLGTLVAGRTREGLMQMFLFAGGFSAGIFGTAASSESAWPGGLLTILGAVMMVAAWIWSIAAAYVLVRRSAAIS